MVHDALLTSRPARPDAAASLPGRAQQLVDALCRLGLQPVLRASTYGLEAPGTGLCHSVRALLSCRQSLQLELARVRALLFARCRVTISFIDADHVAAKDLERVLRQIRQMTSAPCIDRRHLGLTLPGAQLPLAAYLLMSRVWLGRGHRYVLLDERSSPNATKATRHTMRPLFSALYQHRARKRSLAPVYGACLRSRCTLLPEESGDAVTGAFKILAPAGSAWLPVEVNLCRFCSRHGTLRKAQLLAALREGLQLADELFEELDWIDARQRCDARNNRRIAMLLQGIGDMLVLQRADPSSMQCLRTVDRLIAEIHDCVWHESRKLAAQRGLLPSLSARDPSQKMVDGRARHEWRRRWQDALARAAVRHRNLLVMSPYALLPQTDARGTAYADLLPLLAYADALSFSGKPSFSHWSFEDYSAFHLRAIAVMRRRNAASFVATGV